VRLGEGRWNAQHQTFNGFSCDRGDVILFNEFAGFELSINGREYRVIRDVDIIGTFKE
jgi:co-chaperonin GroES (HSP10)